MEDYKELIKEMLLRDFSPEGSGKETYLSTIQILEMVRGVIPSKPIDEHAIFEAMQEAGFHYELCSLSPSERGLGSEEKSPVYLWILYKK